MTSEEIILGRLEKEYNKIIAEEEKNLETQLNMRNIIAQQQFEQRQKERYARIEQLVKAEREKVKKAELELIARERTARIERKRAMLRQVEARLAEIEQIEKAAEKTADEQLKKEIAEQAGVKNE